MGTIIYVPFLLSVILVVLSRRACRRTAPQWAARSVTAAMVVLAGCTVAALGLLSWPLVARVPVVAAAGEWRPAAVSRAAPVPLVVSVLATLALVAVGVSVARRLTTCWRDAAAASHVHAGLAGTPGGDFAVLADPGPVAFALPATPGHRGRVVVSTGLLAGLDDEERAAVLAHEHAHLAHGHRAFLVVARLAAAVNPVLRPAAGHVAFALERWADEDAAARTTRLVAARALAATALAELTTRSQGVALGAAMHLGPMGVPQRVAALLAPEEPTDRAFSVTVVAVVAVIAVAAVTRAGLETERLFETLQGR